MPASWRPKECALAPRLVACPLLYVCIAPSTHALARRFLDIVPINAGKLEALDYVRQRHGFPVGSAVACGDSGNDILMLAGECLGMRGTAVCAENAM